MFVRCCFFAALLTGLFIVGPEDVEARLFGRRNYSSASATGAHMEYVPTTYSTEKRFYNATMSLQDIAYMRAQWMADQESLDHGIHAWTKAPSYPTEVSEGIGSSTVTEPTECATCITGNKVVADASCRSRSGLLYRVRFFR
jgi:hypothetical protein